MATFEDFKRTLAGFIKVNSSDLLDPATDYDIALETARTRYSKYRTKQLTAGYNATGEKQYDLPPTWDSEISGNGYFVEYPVIDANDNPFSIPRYLEADRSGIKDGKLLFVDLVPEKGYPFKLHYEAPYSLNKNTVDIPGADITAVCYLAASVLCKMLSVRYSTTASTVLEGGARVDYQNRANNFLKLSDSFMDDFKSEMFGVNYPAAGSVDWDELEDSLYMRT